MHAPRLLSLAFLSVVLAPIAARAASLPPTTVQDPKVALFPDGRFVVVWTAPASPAKTTEMHARLFHHTGAAASGDFRLLRPFQQEVEDVAATPDGGFLVIWNQPNARGDKQVLARRFDAHAHPLTPAFVVHDPSPDPRHHGRVGVGADGNFVVAWQAEVGHYGDPGTSINAAARFFRPDGTPAGPEIVVAVAGGFGGYIMAPSAVRLAPDGTAVIATDCLCDENSFFVKRFRPDGSQVGSTAAFRGGLYPVLALAADGSYVIAWQTWFTVTPPQVYDHSAIAAQRFGAHDQPLSDVFQINEGGGYEVAVHLAAIPAGGFVALWTDENGRDGDGLGAFARVFHADGTPATHDLPINSQTSGNEVGAALAAGPDIVALWAQDATLGYLNSIDARQFDLTVLPLP